MNSIFYIILLLCNTQYNKPTPKLINECVQKYEKCLQVKGGHTDYHLGLCITEK